MGGSEFGESKEREDRESREDREHAESNERDIDPEDIRRVAKEMVEAAEKGEEWEPEEQERDMRELSREWIEDIENGSRNEEGELNDETLVEESEPSEDPNKEGTEQNEDSKGEEPEKGEDRTNEETEPQKEPTAEDVEKSVKDAVDELAQQEEEMCTQREEREAREVEKQETQERDREERAENEDKDKYDDLEEWIIDTLEKHGVDPEELRKRWDERFVEDVKDELEDQTEGSETQDDETQEDCKSLGEGKTQGSSTSYEDGTGQMYAMEHQSPESSESKQETDEVIEGQEETQSATSERTSQEAKGKTEHYESPEKLEEAQKESDKKELESSKHEEQIEDPEKQQEAPEKQEPSDADETTAESKKKGHKETPTSTTPEKQEEPSEKTEGPREESDTSESNTQPESEEELEESKPTPMFPAGTPKIGTIWRESRREKEQSWDEYVDKKWEELTEEEKEEFKKKIRSQLEDTEDLEEVLKRHELEHLLDNDEVMEDISRYLEFHKRLDKELENGTDMDSAIERVADELEIDQETASKWAQCEDLPDELRDLMARETQWLWHQKMRWIMEMIYPTTLEEIDDSLGSETKKIVKAWLEIREMQKRGEIEFIVKNGEELYSIKRVREFSFKYGVSEDEVVAWLKGKALPSPVRVRVLHSLKTIQKVAGPITEQPTDDGIDIERIKHLYYIEGMSMEKVSQETGLSTKRIQKLFKEQDLTPRPAGPVRSSLVLQVVKKMHFEDDMILSEIAEVAGFHVSTLQKFFKKHGLKPRRDLAAKRRSGRFLIKMWKPVFLGEEIESEKQLLDLVKQYAPGIMSKKELQKLLARVKIHLELYKKLEGRQYTEYGEIGKLSKKFQLPLETMRYLIRKEGRPRFYYFLDEVLMEDRTVLFEKIKQKLNGVTSVKEMHRRLKTLFFYKEFLNTPSYSDYNKASENYLKFWEEFLKGGLIQDIVEDLKISRHTVGMWMNLSQFPTHAKYASLIPDTPLPKGWKWIPLKLNIHTNEPENFIKVPESITSPADIERVIEQLKELDTPEMQQLRTQYGGLSRPIEFMYLLGLIVSDGGFSHNIDRSANVQLTVSKKYNWGLGLAHAFQYVMGLFGFSATRWADDVRIRWGKKKDCMVWGCETSPFFAWMEKALLRVDSNKSKNPLQANWVLNMPHDWRVSFIQGLADGDGWTSIKAFTTGISSVPNKEFLKKLFGTFGISSRFSSENVIVGRHNEILKAKKIPLFRNASGRQKRLDELSKIITSLKPRKAEGKELALILDLFRKGHTPGEITEILWFEYGIARSPYSIYKILERQERNTFPE
ncbi:MAG: hypothetical protein ACTSUO_02575 [Candidatus Thorarchaeota archaeon]